MLKSIRLLKTHRVFTEGEHYEFRPGVNLLVGDQGSGKSTLIRLIRDLSCDSPEAALARVGVATATPTLTATFAPGGPFRLRSFDFENDNPRAKSSFDHSGLSIGTQVAMRFKSHGETVNAILAASREMQGSIVVLDEPDQALSVRSVRRLHRLFEELVGNGCQVIASVHHPHLIEGQGEVLSLEHKHWMAGRDFIASHLKESPEALP